MKGLTALLHIPDWQLDAACSDRDPELFWIDEPRYQEAAIEVCNSCPVRRDCLEHALALPEREGVWGGMTAIARKALAVYRREAVA